LQLKHFLKSSEYQKRRQRDLVSCERDTDRQIGQ